MQGTKIIAKIIVCVSGILCSTISYADFIGLHVGSSYWTPDLTGTFNSSSSANNISINSSVDSELAFTVSLEHPIPIIPNIKLQSRGLNSSGADSVTGLNFNGSIFNGDISSSLDLSHNDIVLYYELLDNWINFDFGLNLKTFDGEITVSDSSKSAAIAVDEAILLVYLSARVDLPFSGFYIAAEIQDRSLSDSEVEGSTFVIGYEASVVLLGFGIEGGYKKFFLGLDDASSLNTAIEYDGMYINGYIHF